MNADANVRVVLEVWAPLQPTAAERQMHPEVIAAADDRVVVRWHQRERSPAGLGFDGQVLGLYEVRQERLARAQMFYFDPPGLCPKVTFRVQPRVILANDQQAVQLADCQMERDGQMQSWRTVGVYRIADGKIAECWLLPFDQYLFDELWS